MVIKKPIKFNGMLTEGQIECLRNYAKLLKKAYPDNKIYQDHNNFADNLILQALRFNNYNSMCESISLQLQNSLKIVEL